MFWAMSVDQVLFLNHAWYFCSLLSLLGYKKQATYFYRDFKILPWHSNIVFAIYVVFPDKRKFLGFYQRVFYKHDVYSESWRSVNKECSGKVIYLEFQQSFDGNHISLDSNMVRHNKT